MISGRAVELADARTLRSYQKDVFAQIESDLDGLLATLGGGDTA